MFNLNIFKNIQVLKKNAVLMLKTGDDFLLNLKLLMITFQ